MLFLGNVCRMCILYIDLCLRFKTSSNVSIRMHQMIVRYLIISSLLDDEFN